MVLKLLSRGPLGTLGVHRPWSSTLISAWRLVYPGNSSSAQLANLLSSMESEGTLLCSWEPTIDLYPEPVEFGPHLHSYLFMIYVNINLPSMSRSPKWASPFKISISNVVQIFHLLIACYMAPTYLDLISLIGYNKLTCWKSKSSPTTPMEEREGEV
jgi:hypothetical protein